MPECIPGVIVTFFPDAGFPARVATIVSQVALLLIIDNTTDPAAREQVARIAAELGAEFLPQPNNGGIAGGLNVAFANLRARGFPAAVAFDQDSTPQPGCVSALVTCAKEDSQRAVVGSNWFDEVRPGHGSRHLMPHPRLPLFFRRVRAAHRDLLAVTFVIASGSWFDLLTWQSLGGFEGSLFLDLVDVDYCLRVSSLHRTVAVAAAAHLAHNRGNKRPVRFLGRTWWPAFIPPARLAGLSANRVKLILSYGWRHPHWATYEIAHTGKILWDIGALEDSKFRKLSAIGKGCLKGLLQSARR
jgi:rhamnosyltransferase